MKKTDIRKIEERLDEEFGFSHFWEEHNGNPDSDKFSPTNANYNRYVGMLVMLGLMGFDWRRIDGLHTIYKR
jgi:predicted metal-dependent hydrolase